MALSVRENFLRNAWLRGHEWIPANVVISGATWAQLREELEEVCLRHPVLFPGFKKGQIDFNSYTRTEEQKTTTDAWGVKWQSELDGLMGLVIDSPLADWNRFKTWRAPEPPGFTADDRSRLEEARRRGEVISYSTEHGFFLMRLYYVRGYESFMMDVAAGEPMLDKLIAVVADYWERAMKPYVEFGLDVLYAADDQGTQTASMLGPKYFRRWLMPTYQRLFLPVRKRGGHVYMHTDGYVMDIMEELIESGLSIVNPQDLVNGIDNLAKTVKGRVCIQGDVDRQSILPFGMPAEVRELIKEEVMKLGSPAGGLEFVAGIYPPTPAQNVEALCSALEEFRTYWVGRT